MEQNNNSSPNPFGVENSPQPSSATGTQTSVQTPVQPPQTYIPPVAPPSPVQTPPPPPKKSSPWPWIVGGCLMIVIIIIASFFVLSWWGARKLKQEILNEPSIGRFKEGIDKMSKESEEWQKKSEEFRDSIPNPEDLQKQMETNIPTQKK